MPEVVYMGSRNSVVPAAAWAAKWIGPQPVGEASEEMIDPDLNVDQFIL